MGANGQRESTSDEEEDAYQSSRKEAIRADISRRLRKICSNLSEAEFDHLVDVMSENKIRGDRRTTL